MTSNYKERLTREWAGFVETLPSRVSETPKEVVLNWWLSHFDTLMAEERERRGFRVRVRFVDGSVYQTKNEMILKNITEIHYNYPELIESNPRIAFESDIDGTGYTYPTKEIAEFEALLHKGEVDSEKTI